MKSKINLIFDYDGTLHNSIKIYGPAFREAYEYLVKQGYAKERIWQDSEISKWLGYSAKDMWNSFMPSLPNEEKERCSSIIGSAMIRLLEDNKAELYDGTIPTLQELKNKGFNLIFLSNCKIQYMKKHASLFKLDKYFNEFYCTEQFNFKPKYEIFKFIKEKNEGDFIVIGDRYLDIEIAKVHNLFSIGCSYGFGTIDELQDANIIIDNIKDLSKVLSIKY